MNIYSVIPELSTKPLLIATCFRIWNLSFLFLNPHKQAKWDDDLI